MFEAPSSQAPRAPADGAVDLEMPVPQSPWQAPSPAWPSRHHTIHDLFEAQVAARPDAVALILAESQLTYAQLNERANRLAHCLIRRGVRRGDMLGLCMERSVDTIVGVLGILKAGAGYVPLDAAYPHERLAFMIRDTAARFVLTHAATTQRLSAFAGSTKIFCVNANANELSAEPSSNAVVGSRPEDLAYVIYTSGSTGNPKGVMVGHRAVIRLVRDTDYCKFGPDEVFVHLAPLAFDASTFEIWGPLLNGGRLVVLPPFPATPDALATLLARHGVTTLWLTSGLFNLVTEQRADAFKNLHQLVAGGDVLSAAHVRRAIEAMDSGVFVNGYGPTENTTFSVCYRLQKGQAIGSTIPIGQPIANTSAFVLDEQMQPVPAGTPGELFVGGDGLAQGYLNNPELTHEKFVANPFGPDRLYRTGDRVSVLPDANLEFLGRIDNQLKIMGHRIEPGEIEGVLRQHPAVRQAVVVARKLPRGDKQLAAYVIPANEADFSEARLKQFLAERLPAHMIPARIGQVADYPLTPNGKVDRAQLVALEIASAPISTAAPTSELEQKIAELWSRILGCPVGPDENFFDAGGTSLQLLEVNAELSRMLGKPLGWTEIFEHPTVRSLAGRLAGTKNQDAALNQAQDRARLQRAAFGRQRMAKGTRP